MEDLNEYLAVKQQACDAALKRNGSVLAKYLWILLLVEIPRLLGTVMTSGLVHTASFVQLDLGQILMLVTGVAYILCLLKLGEVSNRYKYVAWINVALGVIKWVPSFVVGPYSGFMFQYILLWLTYIMNCGAIYLELQGHIDALYRVDVVLSEKWHTLSKGFLIVFGLELVFEFIVGNNSLLNLVGNAGMILVELALPVMHMIKLVFLYQTAKLFRDYEAQKSE